MSDSTAYLVDGVRTPFGRYGGALAAVRPDDLAAHVLREFELTDRSARRALVTMCVGVGQGISLLLEAP